MKHPEDKLFAALEWAAGRRLSNFNAQDVTNAAWACATVKYRDEKLLAALARATEQRLSDFNAQGITNNA